LIALPPAAEDVTDGVRNVLLAITFPRVDTDSQGLGVNLEPTGVFKLPFVSLCSGIPGLISTETPSIL